MSRMTRKRFIKLLMSFGYSRSAANNKASYARWRGVPYLSYHEIIVEEIKIEAETSLELHDFERHVRSELAADPERVLSPSAHFAAEGLIATRYAVAGFVAGARLSDKIDAAAIKPSPMSKFLKEVFS